MTVKIHPIYKLGKNAVRRDARTFLTRNLQKDKKIVLPKEYLFDRVHPGIPLPMLDNDQYGNCVIAARGHFTLRCELIEQKTIIPLTSADVDKEYFHETGGVDSGLVMLDSLNQWRKDGWMVEDSQYKIKAYSAVIPSDNYAVKSTIYTDTGLYVGLGLPTTAADEINEGKPWGKISAAPYSWGGHCVDIVGYDSKYLTCVTWGRLQRMTWPFFRRYCSEAYTVIDALNTPKKRKVFDSKKIELHLAKVA